MLTFNQFYNHLAIAQGSISVANLRYFLTSVEFAFDYTCEGKYSCLHSLEFFNAENIQEIHELEHVIGQFKKQLKLSTVVNEIRFELNNVVVIVTRDTIKFEGITHANYSYDWELDGRDVDLEEITNLYIYSHADSWG